MYTYRVYPDQKLYVLIGRGEISTEEIAHTAKRLLAEVGLEAGWSFLYDLRGARIKELKYPVVLETVKKNRKYHELIAGGRAAAVTDQDVTYGTLRMWQAVEHDRPQEFCVFRSMDEALDYLQLKAVPGLGADDI